MVRFPYEISDYLDNNAYLPVRKPSASQTFYEYNGSYPEGHDLSDEVVTLIVANYR